ncbi:MAG: sulfotransferase [Gammaproteobacteria bacterium]|jgi:hypothetical protein
MPKLFLHSGARFLAMCAQALRRALVPRPFILLRRLMALLVFIPLVSLVQLVNWLCLGLDEMVFPRYRQVRVEDPVFIVGIPRSGTTLLHRALAEDEGFSTFTAWECLFAPSLIQRHAFTGLGRLDRLFGRPLGRLAGWFEARLAGPMASFHGTSLDAPEEDFLALLPAMACFLLVLPFPESRWVWSLGRFDEAVPARTRRLVMAFYRGLVQRHLYFHGSGRRFLSKNPSFSPMVASLRETFPSARIIACLRDPVETVPSQLSSLKAAMACFGHDPASPPFRDRMVGQLAWYYEHLLTQLPASDENRHALVFMEELTDGLAARVTALYQRLEVPMSGTFARALEDTGRSTARFTSRHQYTMAAFGLSEAQIRSRFARAYERMGAAA